MEDYTFEVCTGAKALRSNMPNAVDRGMRWSARPARHSRRPEQGRLLRHLEKDSPCAVQLCLAGLRELHAAGAVACWVTPSPPPAYLSMPEAVFNNADQLYRPWSIEDAVRKLLALAKTPPPL